MAKLAYKNGIASVILRVKVLDTTSTTGGAKTGMAYNTAGLIVSTIADNEAAPTVYAQAAGNIETIAALGTFAAPTASKCRFAEVDPVNHRGLYEIQIANARWSVANARSVIVTLSGAAGAAQVDAEIQLDAKVVSDLAIDGNGFVYVSSGTGAGQIELYGGTVVVCGFVEGSLTAAAIASGALDGKGDWLLSSAYVSGLTPQQARDAMTLAPTPGAPAAGSIDATLLGIQAKAAALGGTSYTFSAPVSSEGVIEIVRGDDYEGAAAIVVTVTNYTGPDLAGGTATLALITSDDYNAGRDGAQTFAGTLAINGSTVAATIALTEAQTEQLSADPPDKACNYVYQLVGITAAGLRHTLALGSMTVRRDVK
jgi:hypothetical protein